jgi:site-specific DNA-methyltransferase (adenine-specific)
MQEFNRYNFTQERSDYLTPPELIDKCFEILAGMGITASIFALDTCCTQTNIPAIHHYIDGIEDGLKKTWHRLNYCNPPYKYCDKWVKKAYQEYLNGKTTVMLIPARTETKYWHEYILQDGQANKDDISVYFLRKGWRFLNPENNELMGVYKNALAIVVFDGRAKQEKEKAVA